MAKAQPQFNKTGRSVYHQSIVHDLSHFTDQNKYDSKLTVNFQFEKHLVMHIE